MAWKNLAPLSGRQMKLMFRKWRQPPAPDLPPGGIVPRSVMKKLQQENVPAHQLNMRLQQLLAEYKPQGD